MLSFIVGVGMLTVLVLWQGIEGLSAIFQQAGYRIWWIPVFYALPLGCATVSWHYLLMGDRPPSWRFKLYATWIGLGVNWLLPVAQIGGELARARLLIKRRYAIGPAIASVVGDKTLQVATQALYTLTGLVLLAATRTQNILGRGALISVLGMGFVTVMFYRLQRGGLFQRFAQVAQRFVSATSGEAIDAIALQVDQALQQLYDARRRLAIALALRSLYRLVMAGEVWLALWILGYPVSWVDAMILESLGQGVRSAAFAVPGGLGAQEGGFILIGAALGLPPQVSLALSLCKRFRELTLGVPGLIAWQIEEGRHLLPWGKRRDRPASLKGKRRKG